MKELPMPRAENILVSLEPRHAESIFDGSKRVELRRRAMHVTPGATMWMYAKLPIGSVVGKVRIEETRAGTPHALWRKFGSVSGISKAEFFSYFEDVSYGVALVLADAVRLNKGIALSVLRGQDKRFHPPQFFARMRPDHPIFNAAAL
jgi:predicted transcriptional regulator